MKNDKLIIVGDSAFAEVAYEYFMCDSPYDVIAFSAEREHIKNTTLLGLPVVPLEELENLYNPAKYSVFVAITYTQLNRLRTRLYNMVKDKGYKIASYVSSKAFVWRDVKIGENCFIFENNTVQPFVRVGNNVILWSGNHIGHHSTIKDNCFLSSHVVVSGFTEIGENCYLGVNSTIAHNLKIAKNCFIDAGTVILKNTEEGKIYRGNPAEASRVGSLRFFKIKEQGL